MDSVASFLCVMAESTCYLLSLLMGKYCPMVFVDAFCSGLTTLPVYKFKQSALLKVFNTENTSVAFIRDTSNQFSAKPLITDLIFVICKLWPVKRNLMH